MLSTSVDMGSVTFRNGSSQSVMTASQTCTTVKHAVQEDGVKELERRNIPHDYDALTGGV